MNSVSDLYTGEDANTSSLLRWTEPLHQGFSTRPSWAKRCQHHNGFNLQAGDAEYETDPKSRLLESTGPRCGTTDEHQGAQETQLQGQEEQEAQLGVVGTHLNTWNRIMFYLKETQIICFCLNLSKNAKPIIKSVSSPLVFDDNKWTQQTQLL